MNIYSLLKSVFSNPTRLGPTSTVAAVKASDNPKPRFSSSEEATIAKQLAQMEKAAAFFIQHYGADFNTFFYRPDLADFIRNEVLSVLYPDIKVLDCLDYDYWPTINYLNFPGPFYVGESDTCGTGVCLAPANVINDEHACEFVFRQPQNFVEFLCVIDAAAVEVLDSYSCNGNSHWTSQLCREWWRGKSELLRRLNRTIYQMKNGNEAQLYIDYLNSTAETDLRKYCYFLENGQYPTDNTSLPLL